MTTNIKDNTLENFRNELDEIRERNRNTVEERGYIIGLFLAGFIFYQYIPFSSVAGYVLGSLITTLIGAALILTHFFNTYDNIPNVILCIWTSLEGKKKEIEEVLRKEHREDRQQIEIGKAQTENIKLNDELRKESTIEDTIKNMERDMKEKNMGEICGCKKHSKKKAVDTGDFVY